MEYILTHPEVALGSVLAIGIGFYAVTSRLTRRRLKRRYEQRFNRARR